MEERVEAGASKTFTSADFSLADFSLAFAMRAGRINFRR